MGLFKKTTLKLKYRKVLLQNIKPCFKTVDGQGHAGYACWMDRNALLCDCGKYRMIDITGNGYIRDDKDTVYPLNNVLSIEFEVIEERLLAVKDMTFPPVYYMDKEVIELPLWDESEAPNGNSK
jgi:hypothetical protein